MEKRQKILIVDDERFNINVLADLLKPNYKIMAAINGKQALKAVQSDSPPDLILLDVMMPEMDGHEVCRKLKADEKTRDIPVIFVTAMGGESDETKGLDIGAVDYITKPISSAIVEARVKTHLSLRQQTRDLQEAKALIEVQKDRMQDELNVAKNIQLSMLPQDFPAYPDHDEFMLHASMEAAREVGGDFYDFFFIDEDHLCVCIGDVSGKGVPAALFMAISKTLIRSRAKNDLSTASILTQVNDEIDATNEAAMFVTVFLAIINIRTGNMLYTNAGHNPPFIKRSNSTLECLGSRHGPVIGAMDGMTYKEDKTLLAKNDLVFLYTDGVTEAFDSESNLFSEKRLADLLSLRKYVSVEDIINSTVSEVNRFQGDAEQADDITVLAIEFLGQPKGKPVQNLIITIRNSFSEIDKVNQRFNTFADYCGIPKTLIQKVNIVFDELLHNIISYAYNDNKEHDIIIELEFSGNRLSIAITDDGIPFNPLEAKKPDTELSLEEREIGGLGIHLVRNLMDKVSYKRQVDKNVISLTKQIQV